MKSFIFITKLVAFMFLFSLIIMGSIISLFLFSNLPQTYAKNWLHSYLHNTLSINASFQSLRGNVYDSITLENIKIFDSSDEDAYPILSIKHASLSFNIFKFFFYNNKIESINHVSVNGVNYYIIRNPNGTWKHIKLSQNDPSQFKFSGNIFINNLSLHYKDYRGWKKEALLLPFQTTIDTLSGTLTFHTPEKGTLNLQGIFENSQEPFLISGYILPQQNDYLIAFKTPSMSLHKWGSYVIAMNGFTDMSGDISVDGYITSKKYSTKNRIPFWYDISFSTNNGTIKTPFVNALITSANGTITISQGIFDDDFFCSMKPYVSKSDAKQLESNFKKNGFTNSKYCLTNQALVASQSRHLHHKKNVQNHIEKQVLNPGFLLTFHDIQGTLSSIPVTLNGTLNLNDKWIEFSVDGNAANSSELDTIFPQLDFLSLQNSVDINASIFGNLTRPVIKGGISSNDLNCFNYTLNNVSATFKYYNDIFNFNLNKGFLFDSLLAGNVKLSMKDSPPSMTSTFFLSDLSLNSVISNTIITGNIDASLSLTGPYNHVTGTIDLLSQNASFLNQSLNSFKAPISISPTEIMISSGNLSINESLSPIYADLKLTSDTLSLSVTGNDILFIDPISSFSTQSGFLSLHGELNFSLQNHVSPFPFPRIGSLYATIDRPYINNQLYDKLGALITFDKHILFLKNFSIENNDSHLNLSGILNPNLSSSFDISISDFDTGAIPYIDSFIPKQFFPLSATIKKASTQLTYHKTSGFSGTSYLNLHNVSLNALSLNMITSHISFSNNTISFDSLNLFKDDSIVYSTGDFNIEKPYFNLDIKSPSKLNVSLFNTLYNNDLSMDGESLVSGNIVYSNNTYSIRASMTAPLIRINSIPLTHTSSAFTFSDKTLTMQEFRSTIDEGSFSLKGSIKNLNQPFASYRLNTVFDDIALPTLQRLSKIIKPSFLNQTYNNPDFSQELSIYSPFYKQDSIIIASSYSSQHEYGFIQSMAVTPKAYQSTIDNIPTILTGSLSGHLDILKNSNKFPILDGSLYLNTFTTDLLSIKKGTILFKSNDNVTDFSCNFQNGLLNQTSFKSSIIKGSLSDTYKLLIDDTTFKTDSYTIHKLLSGSIQLPYSGYTAPHPFDIYLNFSNHNMNILPLISNSISNIHYTGELLLNVSGTLESPLINLLVNSTHDLLIEYPNASYSLTSPPFSLSDNILNFSNLMIQKIVSDPHSSNISQSTSFNGSITLDSLNFTDFESLVSSVDILMTDQELLLNNTIVKGPISMKNTSLTGTIIAPLKTADILQLYDQNNIPLPKLQTTISISDSEVFLPNNQKPLPIPLFLDLTVNISDDVIFSGPIFGNDFFGIFADLDFDQTKSPIFIRGPFNNVDISNQLPISSGLLTILNKNFTILEPSQQQIYANTGSILLNGVMMTSTMSSNGASVLTPLLSLKALYVKENDITAPDNESLPYSHIIMSIDDTVSSIGTIYFDVFESNTNIPSNISELTFIKRYTISNDNFSDSTSMADSDVIELLQLLIPEVYLDESASGLQTIGEAQINTLVRRSILRPLEKNIAKQIGLNDLKIHYNLGKKIISGTDSTLGFQFIKHIFSDRLVLNLSTQMDLSEDQASAQANTMELSEIKLSYYLLKNKNLSLNYSNYKNQLDENETYLSKFSMRYDYEY